MGALIAAALGLAPALVDLLAGEKAGALAGAVAETIAGTSDPEKIRNLPPDKQAELRTALAQIALQERQAELADIASARAQTVSLAQAGSGIAWAAPVISVVIVSGFFACVALLFLVERTWDERTANLLNVLFGALIPGFVQVCNYWLGSSAGSKKSGDAVREIAVRATPLPADPDRSPDDLNARSLAAARSTNR